MLSHSADRLCRPWRSKRLFCPARSLFVAIVALSSPIVWRLYHCWSWSTRSHLMCMGWRKSTYHRPLPAHWGFKWAVCLSRQTLWSAWSARKSTSPPHARRMSHPWCKVCRRSRSLSPMLRPLSQADRKLLDVGNHQITVLVANRLAGTLRFSLSATLEWKFHHLR